MADPVRPLVAIAGAEAVAAVLLTGGVAVSALRSGVGAGMAAAEIGMWALVVLGLVLVWWGLRRRSAIARTPFVLVQMFALVVTWAFVGSDVPGYRLAGIALGVAAVAGLGLALRPSVRAALHGGLLG